MISYSALYKILYTVLKYSCQGPDPDTDTWVSGKKVFVGSNSGINSITSNIITLEDVHKFNTGEKIRFYSDTGSLPDNIESDRDYFVISDGLDTDKIKIALSSITQQQVVLLLV